jgi:hypothetical protein
MRGQRRGKPRRDNMQRHVSFFGSLVIAIALAPCADAGALKFSAEVPRPPEQLPLLGLAVQPAPLALVERLLGQSRVPARLTPLAEAPVAQRNRLRVPTEIVGAFEDERVRAWVNRKTGDLAVYPTLGRLEPLAQADAQSLLSRAREIFETQEFIVRDDTRFVIDKPNILNGQTMVRDPGGAVRTERPKTAYLHFFSARRFVGDLPVDGPGSRAMVEIGNGAAVEGLLRAWKSAKTLRTVRPSRNSEQVRAEIARQLRSALVDADVNVDRIELAYYDANQRYLQPVYRFTAQIHHITMPRTPARTDDDFVIGYIPYAQAFEPLPVLGQSSGPQPRTSPKGATERPARHATGGGGDDPIVGRYVVRNDDAGWVNDANAFWSSLSATWTGSLFTNSQYYWAEPRLFTNQKNSFINKMNLALIEVHGDWWLFSTLKNCCDLVNINGDIPAPGYGPSASGALADWIIHSCEVVPGPDDTATWPDPWWAVFDGVRNVVGYRTIMYINDHAGGPYGTSLGMLAPVVSSWLSDVISLNAYSGHPTTAAHGGVVRPMGRPSTVSACGHDGESVLSVASLPRANCLTVWWFPD